MSTVDILNISKCKWKDGSDSPVVLMIDDLANKWIDIKETEELQRGADWGACKNSKNSFWNILCGEILEKHSHVKTTMFLVTGRREGMIKKGNKYFSSDISENEFGEFLKELSSNENVEIAYHGYTHGICGEIATDFKEEWETFKTLEEAVETIEKGKDIYTKQTGRVFTGGKYCGYRYNEFSDESIAKTGFSWWCRHWDSVLINSNKIKNGELSLEVEYFHNVIDIPSTIDGSFYTLRNYKKIFTKKYLKSLYYKLFKNITLEKQLKYLIDNNLIISIQEHTAKYRVDNRIQYPNIIDDLENINYILKYLKKYDLWYATCGEIADYYRAYSNSTVQFKDDIITIECSKEVEGLELSISLQGDDKRYNLINGSDVIKPQIKGSNQIFNITLKNNNIYTIVTEGSEV